MMTKSDLEKLESKDPKVKYGFAKKLLEIGADNPELLYEHFDYWSELMMGTNNILKWTAIDIIGYLSATDKDFKVDGKIDELFELLHGGALITCNHAIFALGLIAKNKPQYFKSIIKELVAISHDKFETEECKNIATGKVLDTFKPFIAGINDDPAVIGFIEKATKSTRNSTKKKAELLLKKIEKVKG